MTALGTALLLSLVSGCFAAKFVMFPMFGRSHYMILNKLGQELSDRGHEVCKYEYKMLSNSTIVIWSGLCCCQVAYKLRVFNILYGTIP